MGNNDEWDASDGQSGTSSDEEEAQTSSNPYSDSSRLKARSGSDRRRKSRSGHRRKSGSGHRRKSGSGHRRKSGSGHRRKSASGRDSKSGKEQYEPLVQNGFDHQSESDEGTSDSAKHASKKQRRKTFEIKDLDAYTRRNKRDDSPVSSSVVHNNKVSRIEKQVSKFSSSGVPERKASFMQSTDYDQDSAYKAVEDSVYKEAEYSLYKVNEDSYADAGWFNGEFDHESSSDRPVKKDKSGNGVRLTAEEKRQLNRTRKNSTIRRQSLIYGRTKDKLSSEIQTDINIQRLKRVQRLHLLLWTCGFVLISILIFFFELIQSGSIVSVSENYSLGPNYSVLIMFGAKYTPLILYGEWWRFFTAIFVHSGIIQIVFLLLFAIVTIHVERYNGFWSAVFVFMIAGTYSIVLSCVFAPQFISCGSSGAFAGFVGVQVTDIVMKWSIISYRNMYLISTLVLVVVSFVVGLTPILDNFMHMGGFLMGLLISMMLLPSIALSRAEAIVRGLMSFLAFPIVSILFCLTFVIFYIETSGSPLCSKCLFLTCVDFGKDWCQDVVVYEKVIRYWSYS